MDDKKIKILGIGVGALVALFAFRGAKAAGKPLAVKVILPTTPDHKWGPPLALGKNFDLSEFLLSGTFPQLKDYKLTDSELANVKALVEKVLQPVRDKYGMVLITSGGRPAGMTTTEAQSTTDIYGKPIVIPAGTNFTDAMKLRGYNAADHSDHIAFAAVNFEVWDANKKPNPAAMESAFADLKNNQDVRQVILYRDPKGVANNIHVAVVYDGHPRLTGDQLAFEDKAT